jgi:hypothetical protein
MRRYRCYLLILLFVFASLSRTTRAEECCYQDFRSNDCIAAGGCYSLDGADTSDGKAQGLDKLKRMAGGDRAFLLKGTFIQKSLGKDGTCQYLRKINALIPAYVIDYDDPRDCLSLKRVRAPVSVRKRQCDLRRLHILEVEGITFLVEPGTPGATDRIPEKDFCHNAGPLDAK